MIANPIYDTVFKYMMEDNLVAKLVVSSIIGELVVELEPKPQEYTTEKTTTYVYTTREYETFTIYRLDFSAKIQTPDGFKLVLIEMQKASLPTDIMRFRNYLGRQYSNENNTTIDEDGKQVPLQIYAIYFLGKDLGIYDTPVLSVNPQVIDLATKKEIENVNSKFIDSLNHKCWIVQINCLKQRRRNDLEKFLHAFDQENLTSDNHILNVSEEDFPEKYRPIIRRLKMAASDPEVKRQMKKEDEDIKYLKDIERGGYHKGITEGRAQNEAERAKLTETIASQAAKIAELEKLLDLNPNKS